MNPLFVVSVLAGLVAIATALGFALRSQQGRVRVTRGNTVITARDLPGASSLGSSATLLQFSTEVCSPCAVTRRVLGGVADDRGEVAHIDLDLTHRPDLASKFNIMQTPTTFILDSSGIVRARIGGAPKPADIRAELDRILALA